MSMGRPEPLLLTLAFTPTPAGASVRWEADVLGTRLSTFVQPFALADWRVILRALDLVPFPGSALSADELQHLARLGLADEAWLEPHTIHERVGRRLYRALVADPEGARAMDTARNMATAMGRPIAWRLLFPPTAVALAALPWELLWDDGPNPLLLSRGHLASFTRHLSLDEALPSLAARPQGALRILAITPEADVKRAAGEERLRAQRELWARLQAACQVEVTEVAPATRQALVDAFQAGAPPDIVHFAGHGHYRDGTGALVIDRPGGGWDRITADRFAALCGGARMVLLNACQGTMVEPDADLHTAIGPALSASGVPIVLGMQFTISAASATRAAEVLYRALGDGRSVQEAVSRVRQALYVEGSEYPDWYVPTLYIRSRTVEPLYL